MSLRARIVLTCAEDGDGRRWVAVRLDVSRELARKWQVIVPRDARRGNGHGQRFDDDNGEIGSGQSV
jgi:hypothetical protein